MNHKPSSKTDVLIIGAGLSGLVTADRLAATGATVRLVEARPRLGGRILTIRPDDRGAFDLGAAWLWPEHGHVQRLARELSLPIFKQFEQGQALYDRGPGLSPDRFLPPSGSMPVAYRFAGGSGALIERLAARLPAGCMSLNTVVERITAEDRGLTVAAWQGKRPVTCPAAHVVVTLPPRLATRTLTFDPSLPAAVLSALAETQTWMGQAMKVLLIYERPFWREQGLSGLGISHIGPVDQFHDAGPVEETSGALFGWLGNHSPARSLPVEARRQAVINQAQRMFGPAAARPGHYAEQNWAEARYTLSGSQTEQENPAYGHPLLQAAQMAGRLHWAASEVSTLSGGYLDGAVYRAEQVAALISASSI